MSTKVTPRTPAGFEELLPQEQLIFNKMIAMVRRGFELHGFSPIETPALEYAEVLLSKEGGETAKQVYRFTKGRNDLCMRFDLTVPTSRYVAEHFGDLIFPLRRYQIQPVWRAEKSQRGRKREFYQCDIDVIGSESLWDDAVIPAIMCEIFQNLQLPTWVVRINNRKVLSGFLIYLGLESSQTEVIRLIDKLDKKPENVLRADMTDLGLDLGQIDQIFEFLRIKGAPQEVIAALRMLDIDQELFEQGLSELEQVLSHLEQLQISEQYYRIDLTIARGLDYYTGTVYETNLVEYPEWGSICSGGRYDNLVSHYTDRQLSGVGMSIGFTRLFDQLRGENLLNFMQIIPTQVLVVSLQDDARSVILASSKLRDEGISTETYLEKGKFKDKLQYANRKKIPWVIIFGADELSSDEVFLKNMQTGEQEVIDLSKVIDKIKVL